MVVIGLALAAPAGAGHEASRIAEAEDIPLDEWTAMAMGRTLTYRINGELWALERYRAGTNEVTLQLRDGTCIEGTWDYDEPLYCYHWEDIGTSCFRHVRHGDDILILETVNGVETGMIQEMTAVSDLPLACGPAVTS